MFKTLTLITLVLTLLFGAAGVTVVDAKSSDPGEPLYPIKVWTEQTMNRLRVQTQDQLRADPTQPEPGLQTQLRDQARERLRLNDAAQTQDRDQLRLHDREQIHLTQIPAPQYLNSNTPWTTGTPTPNSGYGPGPGTCGTCSGDQNRNRNGAGDGNSKKP